MYLYHMVNSDNPRLAVSEGLNAKTASQWYTNGGELFPEITKKLRPFHVPEWLDFAIAFGAELTPRETSYLKFPVLTDKIAVFNREISSDLFAYVEDEYMEAETGGGYFTKGLPSKEELIRAYWNSRMSLTDYLQTTPYKQAEILIFETIPGTLVEYCLES
ncbi:hypothetical protein HNO89_002266 [Sporosarcina luteola]|nr:hypothetical protein [Sporosarcina luteola]